MEKWFVATAWFSLLALFCAGYVSFMGLHLWTLQSWSFITAAVASLLFATSLSIGSFSYYIQWPNVRHGYQKQIGILAFLVACFYTVSLPILYPETYWYGLGENLFTADVIFGGLAMLIFGSMVVGSSRLVASHIKQETVKFILGLGYVGYAFLVIRAILIDWGLWETWFLTLHGFPPGRLILSVIAVGVLSLRVSIPVHRLLVNQNSQG